MKKNAEQCVGKENERFLSELDPNECQMSVWFHVDDETRLKSDNNDAKTKIHRQLNLTD